MGQGSKVICVQLLKNQNLIADKCVMAERFFERLKGLIGRSSLEAGEGMFFPRCNNIHMMFMRFPIDVVFLSPVEAQKTDSVFLVSSFRENIAPWSIIPVFDLKARDVLELPAGSIERFSICQGDRVCINLR